MSLDRVARSTPNKPCKLTDRSSRTIIALFVVGALSAHASAQESTGRTSPDSEKADRSELGEVVVTGTRLTRPDYRAASPVVTLDAEQFRNVASPTIEATLNTLPQMVASISSTSNNPSQKGQANVALRGLGTNRTLVLLDGHRIVPSQPSGVVDLNLIPPALIENVEIITGGASAVYGSDAIAGVVNIRTRQLEGLQFSGDYGLTSENDGRRSDFSIAGGLKSPDGRGYVFATINYAKRDSIMAGDRDFSRTSLRWNGTAFETSGSAQILQGSWDPVTTNRPTQAAVDAYFEAQDPNYVNGTTNGSRSFGFNDDGSLFSLTPVVNFKGDKNDPLQPFNPNNYTYNINGDLYLEMPLERRSAFAKGGFKVTDNTDVYAQILWGNYTVDAHLPSGNTTSIYVSPDNPNLSPAIRALLASRPIPAQPFRFSKRFTEVGGRERHLDYDVLQTSVGAKGLVPFTSAWSWDLNLSHGNVQLDDAQDGSISRSAFNQLALAADGGASICGAAIDPFGLNSLQPKCAAYIVRNSLSTTELNQTVMEGFVRGDLFNLPAGEAQAAIGLMYKKDDYKLLTDDSLLGNTTDPVTGAVIADVVGWGATAEVRGATHSTELYAETNFPLLAEKTLVKKLDLTLGGRIADHSNAGHMTSYKAEGVWAVVDELSFRSSFQRAVRAPNIGELFRAVGATIQSVGLGDPCSTNFSDPSGNVHSAKTDPKARALCIAQGIPSSALDTFLYTGTNFNAIAGGNPNLRAETANTLTAGIVFKPDNWVPGLQGSVDYYKIDLHDAIGAIQAGLLVNRCFDVRYNPNLDESNFYCSMFGRDAATAVVADARAIDTNVAGNQVRGIDYQLDYGLDTGAGRLSLKWIASNLRHWKQAAIEGDAFQELDGTAGSTWNILPKWKFTTALTYGWGGFDGTVSWRRIGKSHDLNVRTFELQPINYVDVAAGYRFSSTWLDGLGLRVVANNVTNKQPVIYPTYQQVNTDPATYDVLGRRYTLSAIYTFK